MKILLNVQISQHHIFFYFQFFSSSILSFGIDCCCCLFFVASVDFMRMTFTFIWRKKEKRINNTYNPSKPQHNSYRSKSTFFIIFTRFFFLQFLSFNVLIWTLFSHSSSTKYVWTVWKSRKMRKSAFIYSRLVFVCSVCICLVSRLFFSIHNI